MAYFMSALAFGRKPREPFCLVVACGSFRVGHHALEPGELARHLCNASADTGVHILGKGGVHALVGFRV
eukprot:7088381-Pyramimonas_sp.AAC.1